MAEGTTPTASAWTIGRLLTWTTDYLKQHGAESPRLDAEVLLAEARGCSRILLYTMFEEIAPEPLRTSFRELVRRRAEGTPVAYLVGHKEFYSLDFQVTPDVLIPRPETEHLVVRALDLIKLRGANEAAAEIADIGTGSGIIAVCLAKNAPGARLTAIDVSPAALAVAQQNARKHQVLDRIEWIESDLFAALAGDRKFDLIASNPPYIASAEMGGLAASVRNHEPRLALEAGPRGSEVIERLIEQAAERLRPSGWLLCEISPQLDAPLRERLLRDQRWELQPTLKDLAGLSRVVQLRRAAG
ncbi:MAG TPA: peptide chain release factor N(5)-glutamine methyltransferase [Pirellulales bacterium]|jgi:release factor glutamine methyltransferase|nr:peptide chain release factor N(5)-glutamine methyltransferase [Pirellulales bacterium]